MGEFTIDIFITSLPNRYTGGVYNHPVLLKVLYYAVHEHKLYEQTDYVISISSDIQHAVW